MPDPVNRVEWLGEQAGEGCVERSFLLRRRGEPVPGVLWSPGSAAPQATVLFLETISALAGLGPAEHEHVSVFGMSMGARFGLPVAAALGPRLRCAVLGKFGIRQARPLHPGLCAPDLVVAAARAVTAPVLYHVQWDDAIFPRDGSSSSSMRWPQRASA